MYIVLLPSPPIEEIGGVAAHVFRLAKGLEELGHKVLVIQGTTPRWFRWLFVRLPEVFLAPISLSLSRKYRRKVEDLYFFMETLGKTRGKMDVVNMQNVQHAEMGTWLRRLTGCKAVLTVHGYLTYEAESSNWCKVGDKTHLWLWELEMKGYGQFDALVCVGSRVSTHIQQFTSKPVTIVPNGLDLNLFRPKVRNVYPGMRINILFAGFLQPSKGIMDAIQAVELLVADYKVDAVLHVAGEGPLAEAARKYVVERELTERVIFRGVLSKAEMAEFYRNGHILLFPSRQAGLSGKSEESSPYTVLEAMASGLAVVAYRSSALEALVQEGKTGYLAEPDNVCELVKRLGDICTDTGVMREMQIAARLYSERHCSQTLMAQRYVTVYTSLMEQDKDSGVGIAQGD